MSDGIHTPPGVPTPKAVSVRVLPLLKAFAPATFNPPPEFGKLRTEYQQVFLFSPGGVNDTDTRRRYVKALNVAGESDLAEGYRIATDYGVGPDPQCEYVVPVHPVESAHEWENERRKANAEARVVHHVPRAWYEAVCAVTMKLGQSQTWDTLREPFAALELIAKGWAFMSAEDRRKCLRLMDTYRNEPPQRRTLTEYVQALDELVESAVSVARGFRDGKLDLTSGTIAVNQLIARWKSLHKTAETLNIRTDTDIPEPYSVAFIQMMGRSVRKPPEEGEPCQTKTPTPETSDTSCPSG